IRPTLTYHASANIIGAGFLENLHALAKVVRCVPVVRTHDCDVPSTRSLNADVHTGGHRALWIHENRQRGMVVGHLVQDRRSTIIRTAIDDDDFETSVTLFLVQNG